MDDAPNTVAAYLAYRAEEFQGSWPLPQEQKQALQQQLGTGKGKAAAAGAAVAAVQA